MGRTKRRGKTVMYVNPKAEVKKIALSCEQERFAKHLKREGQVCQFSSVLTEVSNPGFPASVVFCPDGVSRKYKLLRVWSFPPPKGDAFRKFTGAITDRLFHGTHERSIGPIVLQGFKLPTRSGMFGQAVYVSPQIHKAFGFTDYKAPLIFVSEGKLGQVRAMDKADKTLFGCTQESHGFDTAHGKAGVTESWNPGHKLYYNEYAVYDPARLRLRYLLEYK